MQCQRASGKKLREQPKNTAEVQGNYAKFKESLALLSQFCYLKSKRNPAGNWKCCLRAARSHKLTTMVSSEEIWIAKQSFLRRVRVFPINYVWKLGWENFLPEIKITWTLRRCWGLWGDIQWRQHSRWWESQ